MGWICDEHGEGVHSSECTVCLHQEVKRLRASDKHVAYADFDNMTPKEIRELGETLSHRANQFGEMRATLQANCEPGQALHDLGATYNEHRSALNNLVSILFTLQRKIQQVEKKHQIGWFNPGDKRFCYSDQKESYSRQSHLAYTIPVFIEQERPDAMEGES